MSVVTNIILTCDLAEEDAIAELQQRAFGHQHMLKSVEFIAGGNKCLECMIYVGAINHLDLETFKTLVRTMQWQEPDSVRVFVRGQYDDFFTVLQ